MTQRRRYARNTIVVGLTVALAGCGQNTVAPPPGGGGQEPLPSGPFKTIEIYLRPLSIMRPPAAGVPTPALDEYYLSVFYSGGPGLATFEWEFPTAIGTVTPKTPNLGVADATVDIRPDGHPPLGFFDVVAHGTNGTETSTFTGRFAVIENRWMKHRREYFTGTEPEDLAQYPTFITEPSGTLPPDSVSILYVVDKGTFRTLYRIPAFAGLSTDERQTNLTFLQPQYPAPTNVQSAASTQPDISPTGLQRREMIFSSRMDPQYASRCPREPCENIPPFRLWVGRYPDTSGQHMPKVLTSDTTYAVPGGAARWAAYNYLLPRWDPSSTSALARNARIAFISDRADDPTAPRSSDLWVANLADVDADGTSDQLENLQKLTTTGGISSFSWHPDGSRLIAVGPTGLEWIDLAGATTEIRLPDSLVTRVAYPDVYWKPGEHTLVVFQAQKENLRNLFVWDEQDNKLVKLLPFPVPVSHNLFPRWHPKRKAVVYISDYTVMAWANSSGGTPSPDKINPQLANYYSIPRTVFPSPWVISLQ